LAEDGRAIEDRLREEYFQLLPEIRRVAEQLETEARFHLLPISRALKPYERLVVRSRVKDCESALDSLRRRQPDGAAFDLDHPELYTLTHLNDLAGIRIMAFPRSRLGEIENALRMSFPNWTADPVEEHGELTAFTYYGHCQGASDRVKGEYQIVSMLTGLFWEVEHSAMYKPSPDLKGVARSLAMQERYKDVLGALKAFEEEFEASVRISQLIANLLNYTPQQ
jgi:ppGpp synthetase/RelA/SpoT-type nucleotidyltranferase